MTDEGVVSEEIILRARTFFASALTAGCDQLNEIAVSDRGTMRGLTQFCRRLSLPRLKPLNPIEIEERLGKSSACAIISVGPLANC